MRDFSTFEKKVIGKILNVFSRPGGLSVLGNVLEYELDPNIYISLESEQNCPVKIKNNYLIEITNKYGSFGLSELIKEIESKLLLTLKLVAYLENENLLILSGDLSLQILGQKETNADYADYNLEDPSLIKLLYSYSRKKLTPTEGLSKLVKNDFRSDEEIRLESEFRLNKKSFKWTAVSVIIAGLALLASLITPIFQDQNISFDKKTILYIDSIMKSPDSSALKNKQSKISADSTLKKGKTN
jgi:hypothetical protein